jgi:hypothetical protein
LEGFYEQPQGPKQRKQTERQPLQASWRSLADQFAHDQAQIETAHMHQQPFQDVFSSA